MVLAIVFGLMVAQFTAGVSRAQTKVWIDTDPSIGLALRDVDDGFALVQAFHSPEIQVCGISATYGNASVKETTRIARAIAERFGIVAGVKATDVYAGAAGPDDLGRVTPATTALTTALSKQPLVYLALGPLTDLASLLKLHPELVSKLSRVVFLGGRSPGERFYLGSRLPYEFHDANFEKDPLAALTVLSRPIPVEMVPLRTSAQVLFTSEDLARLAREGSSAGRFLADNSRTWLSSWQHLFGLDGGPAFDCLAVLAVTHPEDFETAEAHVCVSDRLDVLHPAAFGDPADKTFLLLDRGTIDRPPSGRIVLDHFAVRATAKRQILRDLISGPATRSNPRP